MKSRKPLARPTGAGDTDTPSLVEHMRAAQRLLRPTPRRAPEPEAAEDELEQAMRRLDRVNEALSRMDDLDDPDIDDPVEPT